MSYNGWATYETWAMGMYVDGSYSGDGESIYRYWQEIAKRSEKLCLAKESYVSHNS